MTAVTEVLWLGLLLGVGSALAVGPIFVVIVQQAATSGFAASFRVILGSATADLLLLLPALAFTWVIRSVDQGALWVGAVGAVFLCWLAWQAARDTVALWREDSARALVADGRWAFWKGVAGNLANPLTWTFWLATGTPAMLAARRAGGMAGLALFTATWFLVASGLEAVIALAVARSHRLVGSRGQAWFTAVSAVAFLCLAATLVARDVLPRLG
jgi:threonine/homoserine/homoserine lactone efflux protein